MLTKWGLIDMTSKIKNAVNKLLSTKQIGILIPLILLIIAIGAIRPVFYSTANISAVIKSMAFIGIVAVGETLVVLLGVTDISVGSVAGLAAVTTCHFATKLQMHPVLAIICALCVAACVGLFNGVVIVKLKLPAFITTMGTMYIAKGINYVITKGYPIYPLPELLNKIGGAKIGRLSISFLVLIFFIIFFEFILKKTTYGRSIYAIGDNEQVAMLAGINVTNIKISVFMLASVLAGVGGILTTLSLESGISTTGSGWELQAIAATAIGGTSMMGGSGSMIGTLIGILILNILNNGLVLIGVDTNWQTICVGIVMIIAVLLDIIRNQKKLRG